MLTERLIAFKNGFAGKASLRTSADQTEVELLLRGGERVEYAHLYNSAAHISVPIYGARGNAAQHFEADAVILEFGGEAVAWGGFAGDVRRVENAKRDIRIAAQKRRDAAGVSDNKSAPPKQDAQADNTIKQVSAAQSTKAQNSAKHTSPQGAKQQSSDALISILKKAEELFGPLQGANQAAGGQANPERQMVRQTDTDSLFPGTFPAARWKRVEYPGTGRYYLEGEMEHGGVRYMLHALPGEYSPVSPNARGGFNRFIRAADGSGYWVRVRRYK
ncbi:MAG: hypothetical protein RR232_07105 [Clostridia bacterium]